MLAGSTLMHRMGVEALYCRPRTSIPPRDAKIYRYLLDGLAIERHNRRRILQSHEYQYQTSDEITAKPSAIAA
jgi:hypothetical protein